MVFSRKLTVSSPAELISEEPLSVYPKYFILPESRAGTWKFIASCPPNEPFLEPAFTGAPVSVGRESVSVFSR
jgi:hypothetical protein